MSICAIYTRVAGARDLDQEHRLLAEQRATCEAFIGRRRQFGWVILPERFDDGGCSGAHVNRPALARLLVAIETGRVNAVIATRVDRLFTSLIDAVRIVDRFEEAGAVFYAAESVRLRHTGLGGIRRARGVSLHLPEELA